MEGMEREAIAGNGRSKLEGGREGGREEMVGEYVEGERGREEKEGM